MTTKLLCSPFYLRDWGHGLTHPNNTGLEARLPTLALASLIRWLWTSHLNSPSLFPHLSNEIALGKDFQTYFNLKTLCAKKSYQECPRYKTPKNWNSLFEARVGGSRNPCKLSFLWLHTWRSEELEDPWTRWTLKSIPALKNPKCTIFVLVVYWSISVNLTTQILKK